MKLFVISYFSVFVAISYVQHSGPENEGTAIYISIFILFLMKPAKQVHYYLVTVIFCSAAAC